MLHGLIYGPATNDRHDLIALLKQPPFDSESDDTDRDSMQRRIYEQLKLLNGWAGGGSGLLADRQRLFSALAFAAAVSPPLFNVAQAHYGVCLASIKALGKPSTELDRIIADIDSLSSVAAILITEVGVACSHLAVSTRADYDPVSGDFVLATPDASACKLMANVALNGVAKTGLVFAQLWVDGLNHGLFPFVVPIRDRERVFEGIHVRPLPGRSSMGLDYSVVSFTRVRVPRSHWLQDSVTLSADGRFHDPLGSTDKRLIRSLGVSANASTAAAAGVCAAARACIWTNLRYAQKRKTKARFGADRVLLEFRNQQDLLFGALAEAFVISHLARRLVDGEVGESIGSTMATVPWAAINRMGALTKAITVAGAADVIRNCRLASGAHGCIGANRFGDYEDLTDAYSSAGGDNQLILIEIGRDLASSQSKFSGDAAAPESLDNAAALRQLARFEECRQHGHASHGLPGEESDEENFFTVWNPRLPALLDLARTYGRRIALECFLDNEASAEDSEAMLALATIYAVKHFNGGLAYQTRDRALARAFDVVMRHLDRLLDAFELSPELIRAPMAQDDYVLAYVRDLPVGR
jgi:acyl-CoA oxidase